MSLFFLCIQGRPFFDSVVLVVRNPFHAMISEWNRELSTKYGLGQGNGTAHTNVYGREYFRELLKINLHCLYIQPLLISALQNIRAIKICNFQGGWGE